MPCKDKYNVIRVSPEAAGGRHSVISVVKTLTEDERCRGSNVEFEFKSKLIGHMLKHDSLIRKYGLTAGCTNVT